MDSQRYIEIDGEMIAVTEEVYRAYKRPLWAERKRKEREMRCLDDNGNICTRNCRTCHRERTSRTLSLDKFTDDGFDVPVQVDMDELVADRILYEALAAALAELDPQNRRIVQLFNEGLTEREIAAEVGLSQKGVNKRKTAIFGLLREKLEDFR